MKPLLVLAVALLATAISSAEPRSRPALAEFKRAHPCPATGSKGACKGYVVDHVVPLACGGVDAPTNMQWQTTADAKAKDRIERKGCQKPPGLRGM